MSDFRMRSNAFKVSLFAGLFAGYKINSYTNNIFFSIIGGIVVAIVIILLAEFILK